jgi:2-polyprenyl-3-methyl-5-hydroxy-6-metoxy-1,4-benzoquinol methylase
VWLCVQPGGCLVLSTINRTAASFLGAIGAAEYVLGWVPRGTHAWRKFVRPAELHALLAAAGMQPLDEAGMALHPLRGAFELVPSTVVNYLVAAARPPLPAAAPPPPPQQQTSDETQPQRSAEPRSPAEPFVPPTSPL